MSPAVDLSVAVESAVAVAVATTFDDIIYLTAFFGDKQRNIRTAHVIAGEFVGFSVLIGISLIASQLVIHMASSTATGWLGVIPILVGVYSFAQLFQTSEIKDTDAPESPLPASIARPSTKKRGEPERTGLAQAFVDHRSYFVAMIAISNGANNLAVYIPLLGNSRPTAALLTIAICYLAIVAWIFLAYYLTRLPGVASLLSRYANQLFPFVLMWLGFRILSHSGVLSSLN